MVDSPTAADVIPVTVLFNQTVGDFDVSDLNVTGANISNFQAIANTLGKEYSFDLTPAGFPSEINIQTPAGSATNSYGRKNALTSHSVDYRAHRVREADLLAWWKFDETSGNVAEDSAGGDDNGTITSATWQPDGKFGGALELGTAAKAMSVAGLANELKTATISFWARPRSVTEQAIINNDFWAGDVNLQTIGHRLVLYSSNLDHRGLPGIPTDEFWSGSVLQSGKWNHVALTYDLVNKSARFYFNGIFDAETPFAGTHALHLEQPFRVGSNVV